jgi:hypothetical protein
MIRPRSALMFRQVLVVTKVCRRLSGVAVWVGSWLAEEAGERGDDLERAGVGAGLLVGEVPGLVFGDGAAVLGVGGELADPGGQSRVDGGRAARADAVSRG